MWTTFAVIILTIFYFLINCGLVYIILLLLWLVFDINITFWLVSVLAVIKMLFFR